MIDPNWASRIPAFRVIGYFPLAPPLDELLVLLVLGAPEPAQDYLSFFQDPALDYLAGVREPGAALGGEGHGGPGLGGNRLGLRRCRVRGGRHGRQHAGAAVEQLAAQVRRHLDAGIGPAAKDQMAAEVIFLTHNEGLHQVNLGWHPRAEELLWRPELQERKRSQSGQSNVRYRSGDKRRYVEQLTGLLADRLPYCRVRYAF